MRFAVIASSMEGCQLAFRIRQCMTSPVEIYIHDGVLTEPLEGIKSYFRLSELVGDMFQQYSGLIFIMSSGIVVRSIAPFLHSKLTDPAVLVMDCAGRNIVSLLSGHLGGANDLTLFLSEKLGANPVITTATDTKGILAPDLLAARLALKPYPKEGILHLNNALLEGKEVYYWIDEDLTCIDIYMAKLKREGIEAQLAGYDMLRQLAEKKDKYQAIISDKDFQPSEKTLILRPRMLVAGIGCRRGVPKGKILQALTEACDSIGWTTDRVNLLASTVVKQKEQGLLDLANSMSLEIKFWPNEKLQEQIEYYGLEESDFVKKTIGIGNVAESSALGCVTHGIIASPKTKYEKVTVSLVWEK